MGKVLEVQNVSKHYAEHTALDNVSMEVPQGEIFGLLGPNGAGKTSLIRIINQITAPDSGQILFEGEKLKPEHRSAIGYLPEERGLYKKMEVGEQLLYLAQLKGLSSSKAKELLKSWFVKFEIEPWWNKKVEDLSKGMQQKVQFVSTVLHQPKLLILDEPFSGFDPINANLIKDEILELKENGSTIIFSTHRMDSVEELCDNIALINNSKVILNGSKEELKNQFKEGVYKVKYKGQYSSLPNWVQVENSSTKDDLHTDVLKIVDNHTGNDLIQTLIGQVEVLSFEESIPSMNDVFIKAVNS